MADTGQITAVITPSDATNKNVTWGSSNPSVATVSASGLVTAKSAGTCKISGTTQDGGFSASSDITVVAGSTPTIPVTGVSVSPKNVSLEYSPPTPTVPPSGKPVTGVTITGCPSEVSTSDSGTLTAVISPADAGNKNVTWELETGGTSDGGHISITPNGLKCGWALGISATAGNQYGIKVTTRDGGFSDLCRFNVGGHAKQEDVHG